MECIHIGMMHKTERATAQLTSRAASLSQEDPSDFTCRICNYVTANATGLKHHIHGKHGSRCTLSQPPRPPPSSPSAPNPLPGPLRRTRALDDGAGTTGQDPTPTDPYARLTAFKRSLRVLPRIPQAARAPAARKYIPLLEEVAISNRGEAWLNLLEFPYRTLHVPTEVGVKPLATCDKENLTTYDRSLPPPAYRAHVRRERLTDARCAKAAEARLASRGDTRGAIRLLSSSETLVTDRRRGPTRNGPEAPSPTHRGYTPGPA